MERMPGIHFKKCCTCKAVKPIAVFYKDKGQKDGHEPRCKICRKASVKKTNDKNFRAYQDKRNAWNRRNRDKCRVVERKSYQKLFKKNPERYRDKVRRRQKNVRQAIPKWETKKDRAIIKDLYAMSNRELQVDHIIPLKHKLACGLHTPDNLQVSDGQLNSSKNNKMDLTTLTLWPTCDWPRKKYENKKA